MKFEVRVQLKKNVLNVEAKEVMSSIVNLGNKSIVSLDMSKLFVIEVSGDEKNPHQFVENIAKSVLCNEVIENFYISPINDK